MVQSVTKNIGLHICFGHMHKAAFLLMLLMYSSVLTGDFNEKETTVCREIQYLAAVHMSKCLFFNFQAFLAPFSILVAMFSALSDRIPKLSMTEDEIKLRAQSLTDTDLQDKQNGNLSLSSLRKPAHAIYREIFQKQKLKISFENF